jgi:hypothetical protein
VAKEYMASVIPRIKIEIPKMNRLTNKINCPIDREVRLLNKIAKTSVPSKQPPNRMVIPTPKPRLIPPRIITKMGLWVMTGNGSNRCVPNESTRMANRLSITNLLPKYEYAIKKKGVFKIKRYKPTSCCVICDRRILIPMIPPSIT